MKFRDFFSLKHIIFAVVLMALMLLFAVGQSNNTVKATFAEDHISVSASKFGFKILYSEIESVELADLGDPGEKLDENAWDDDIVRYGHWVNDAWGEYIACVDPDTTKCVVVTIEDGRTLVFSRKNDATTEKIYNELLTYID